VRANQLLRTGGIQVFICSNSWLDVGFGAQLQQYFLSKYTILKLIDSRKERQFASADVNTVISFIRKSIPVDEHEVDFVMIESDFENSIRNRAYLTSRLINQKLILEKGISRDKYTGQRLSIYHRAPEVYLNLLEVLRSNSTNLGAISEIFRGPVTGCNDFFFLDNKNEWLKEIESEYLFDIIRRPAECKTIKTSFSERGMTLFSSSVGKYNMNGKSALKYISEGELTEVLVKKGQNKGQKVIGYHNLPTTKTRGIWYNVNLRKPAPILWMEIMGSSHRVFYNDENLIHSDKFYGIYPKNNNDIDPLKLCIWLNSTPVMLHKLLSSFNSLGLGALKTPVYEVANIPIPNNLNSIELNSDALESILTRPINDVALEVHEEDRILLEAPIYELLGLSKSDEDAIRSAISSFMRDREAKANKAT